MSPDIDAVTRRYQDAYGVANALVAVGNGIKVAGMVGAGVINLLGFLAPGSLGFVVVFLLAAVAGGIVYILGVLIAAQGQMQHAILDVAVNTSPTLPAENKTAIISTTQVRRGQQ